MARQEHLRCDRRREDATNVAGALALYNVACVAGDAMRPQGGGTGRGRNRNAGQRALQPRAAADRQPAPILGETLGRGAHPRPVEEHWLAVCRGAGRSRALLASDRAGVSLNQVRRSFQLRLRLASIER